MIPAPIEIRPVANGYLVMPGTDYTRNHSATSVQEMRVFETFESLVEWMSLNLKHKKKASE